MNKPVHQAYQGYLTDLQAAWRRPCVDENDRDCVIQDGVTIRVPLNLMDSCQCAVAASAPIIKDSQREESDQRHLAAIAQDQIKVNAWADHFTALRQQDAGTKSAYDQYCDNLNNARSA